MTAEKCTKKCDARAELLFCLLKLLLFCVLVVVVAGENIRFSSLFPAEDGEERGETDAGKSEDKQRMFS